MLSHKTSCRVIYGDTDKMGVAYHANYLRWFEMGRSAMFRHLGLPYTQIEEKGIGLPVTEAWCKYIAPARYDDEIIIETVLKEINSRITFDYSVFLKADEKLLVKGFTKHAFVTMAGKVIRPPVFLTELIEKNLYKK